MALESRGPKAKGGHHLPGLGALAGARVISAPRIIVQENEEATIESGVSIPSDDGGQPEVRPSLRADTLFRWEEEGIARVDLEADLRGRLLRGSFRLRPAETAVMAAPYGEGHLVVVLTFRPVE